MKLLNTENFIFTKKKSKKQTNQLNFDLSLCKSVFHDLIVVLYLMAFLQMQDQMRSFREELQKKDALIQQLVR